MMIEQKRYFNFGTIIKIELENKIFQYPSDYYRIYLSTAPKYIKKIIEKWENGRDLTERDYYQMLNKIFSNTYAQIKNQIKSKPSVEAETEKITDIWGLEISNGKLAFKEEVAKEAEVKILLFCLEQFLRPYAETILKKYFANYKLNLINWNQDTEYLKPESLDHVIKSAYLFTLYNYLWINEDARYNFFVEYFSTEFEKRVSFINRLKEGQRPGEGIEYIPIFDDFRNFDPEKGAIIAQMISRVLKQEDISGNERKVIEEALYNHAKTILNFYDDHAAKIRDSILTPVVSEMVSLHKSKEFLAAAETCFEKKLFNSVINRSYYAMLRAARAALVNFGYIKPWRGTSLRPSQSHDEVIHTFNQYLIYEKKIFPKELCSSMKDAFKHRLIADYADQEVEPKTAQQILNNAKKFIAKVEEVVS